MNIVWTLTPKKDGLNYVDLITKIANEEDLNLKDYRIGQVTSVVQTFKDDFIDYVSEHGLTALIESGLLTEQVIPKGASPNNIVGALHKYLDKVGIDNELIIIDPYFFAPTPDITYVSTIESVLDRYLPKLDTIHIITSLKVDPTLVSTIEGALKTKKPTLNIIHKTSSDYHDRFWISNSREKGIITGTSINGYGKKYALLDRLNTSDVREIVSSL